MSNLTHAIYVLVAERKIIETSLQHHGNDITKKKERIDGISEAINILNKEKMKDEMKKETRAL